MADNYLEKRYEEIFGRGAGAKRAAASKKGGEKGGAKSVSLNSLLLKNRSYRGYDQSYIVSEEELKEIVSASTKVPSARNQQVLRFKVISRDSGGSRIADKLHLGGALPELQLPAEGTAPQAFIVVCSTVQESKWVDIDLGIAAQSMLLRAVELGLRGICIGAFEKEALMRDFALPYEPLLLIAIGKGAENIQLLQASSPDSLQYWRKGGVHFVPKLSLTDILL